MLARLLDEQLDEADHASIVDHVESCVICQERLKELTGDDSRLLAWEPIERSLTNLGLAGAPRSSASPFRQPSSLLDRRESECGSPTQTSIDRGCGVDGGCSESPSGERERRHRASHG